MKQGPFPHRRFCCPRGSSGTTGPSATLPAGTRLHGITAYTRPSLPEHQPAGPGPGRASPVPASTLRPFRSLYPGGFFTAASRLFAASMAFAVPSPARLPLGPLAREKLTGRQDSLHATDRSLARPHGTLDAGLRRRAFPPDAASLLPGALALTGTGHSPAGGCELMFGSDHLKASPPNLWAHDRALMTSKVRRLRASTSKQGGNGRSRESQRRFAGARPTAVSPGKLRASFSTVGHSKSAW